MGELTPPKPAVVLQIPSIPALIILVIATWTAVFTYFFNNPIPLIGTSPSDNAVYLICYILPVLYCSIHAVTYVNTSNFIAEATEPLFRRLRSEDKIKVVVFSTCGTASLAVFSSFWTDALVRMDQAGLSWSADAAMPYRILAASWTSACITVWFFTLFAAWVVAVGDWIALWDMVRSWNEECLVREMEEMEEGRGGQ